MNIGGAIFGSPCQKGREQGKQQPSCGLKRLSPDAHREPATKPVDLQARSPSLTVTEIVAGIGRLRWGMIRRCEYDGHS